MMPSVCNEIVLRVYFSCVFLVVKSSFVLFVSYIATSMLDRTSLSEISSGAICNCYTRKRTTDSG